MSDRRQSEDRFASVRHLALSGCGRIRPTYLAVMATIILCTLLPTAHADYSYHKQITIDHNKVSGSSNLSNFPVLISVIDGDLRTTANGGHVTSANGYDIVFGTLTGAQFDHEIEEYDGATGKLVAWVRAPTVYHNINTIIYMCYGDSSPPQPRLTPSDSTSSAVILAMGNST